MDPSTQKMVLVVDAEPMRYRAIQRYLSINHPGIGWAHAKSFAEAKAFMNEFSFDCVITDANIPIEGSEKTAIAYRFVMKECREREIRYFVVSGMEKPQGFADTWLRFDDCFDNGELGEALRIAVWPRAACSS